MRAQDGKSQDSSAQCNAEFPIIERTDPEVSLSEGDLLMMMMQMMVMMMMMMMRMMLMMMTMAMVMMMVRLFRSCSDSFLAPFASRVHVESTSQAQAKD